MPAKPRDGRNVKALPAGYRALLENLKARIRSAQAKATLTVNRALIALYWNIGKAIVERQRAQGWGGAVVERLARDLQREFPGTSGFSPRNIWRMRSFYLAWSGRNEEFVETASRTTRQVLPQAATELPWFHNVALIETLKNPAERRWYAQQAIANGWSRSMLLHWIESGLHARQGRAVTDFEGTLPPHSPIRGNTSSCFRLRRERTQKNPDEGGFPADPAHDSSAISFTSRISKTIESELKSRQNS